MITGPTTVTLTIGYTIGGSLSAFVSPGKPVSLATQCLTDTFSLTGPSGSAPPTICGTNTGEHSNAILSLSKKFKYNHILRPY